MDTSRSPDALNFIDGVKYFHRPRKVKSDISRYCEQSLKKDWNQGSGISNRTYIFDISDKSNAIFLFESHSLIS